MKTNTRVAQRFLTYGQLLVDILKFSGEITEPRSTGDKSRRMNEKEGEGQRETEGQRGKE